MRKEINTHIFSSLKGLFPNTQSSTTASASKKKNEIRALRTALSPRSTECRARKEPSRSSNPPTTFPALGDGPGYAPQMQANTDDRLVLRRRQDTAERTGALELGWVGFESQNNVLSQIPQTFSSSVYSLVQWILLTRCPVIDSLETYAA